MAKPAVAAVTATAVLAALTFGGWERILVACALCLTTPINWRRLP